MSNIYTILKNREAPLIILISRYNPFANVILHFVAVHLVADLLVGLISVLTDIIWRTTVAWYAGNIACKLIRFMQAVVTYSSTYVLVALSIDRYDAITRPMNFSGSCEYISAHYDHSS